MKFTVKKLLNRIENSKPEHISLLVAWLLLIMLSFVIGDVKLLSYIHHNAYTKVGFVVLIQAITFSLIIATLKASKSNAKETN